MVNYLKSIKSSYVGSTSNKRPLPMIGVVLLFTLIFYTGCAIVALILIYG